MEILMEEEGLSSYMYQFELSEYKSSSDKIPIGIQILFSLYSHKDFNFKSMSAEEETDIGEPRNILRIKRSDVTKYFCNVEILADVFFKRDLIDWTMIGEYQGKMVKIFGDYNNNVIDFVDLNYPSDSDIDVVSMMQDIEKSSIL